MRWFKNKMGAKKDSPKEGGSKKGRSSRGDKGHWHSHKKSWGGKNKKQFKKMWAAKKEKLTLAWFARP